ncbi:MAG: hypothetical protein ACREV3_08460 [Gammaproteobacteria bacterium]
MLNLPVVNDARCRFWIGDYSGPFGRGPRQVLNAEAVGCLTGVRSQEEGRLRKWNRFKSGVGLGSGRCEEIDDRAGDRGSARAGKPRCMRILAITVGSSMAAMIFKGLPHRGRLFQSAPARAGDTALSSE